MKNHKETKVKLLASAKEEFMEKGYMKASLRNICKNAGVTTGALYFFFKDKEDLFSALVEEPLNKLYEVMNYHYLDEINEANDGLGLDKDFSNDIEAARMTVHYMYKYYDEFQLVLTKSQGSRFEDSIDKFVTITEQHYRVLSDKIAEMSNKRKVNDFTVHWTAHMTIDVFVHILTHEKSEEAALSYVEDIIKYLISGWQGMFK